MLGAGPLRSVVPSPRGAYPRADDVAAALTWRSELLRPTYTVAHVGGRGSGPNLRSLWKQGWRRSTHRGPRQVFVGSKGTVATWLLAPVVLAGCGESAPEPIRRPSEAPSDAAAPASDSGMGSDGGAPRPSVDMTLLQQRAMQMAHAMPSCLTGDVGCQESHCV